MGVFNQRTFFNKSFCGILGNFVAYSNFEEFGYFAEFGWIWEILLNFVILRNLGILRNLVAFGYFEKFSCI